MVDSKVADSKCRYLQVRCSSLRLRDWIPEDSLLEGGLRAVGDRLALYHRLVLVRSVVVENKLRWSCWTEFAVAGLGSSREVMC